MSFVSKKIAICVGILLALFAGAFTVFSIANGFPEDADAKRLAGLACFAAAVGYFLGMVIEHKSGFEKGKYGGVQYGLGVITGLVISGVLCGLAFMFINVW